MKMFAVLALAAVAFGEPEPQVVYSGTPLSTVYNTPYTYSSPLFRAFTPYTNAFNGVYGSPVVHTIGKRDADAEPATVYTTGLPVTTYGAVSHVAGVNSIVAPVSTYSAVSPVVSQAAVKPVVSYSAVRPVSTYSSVGPVATYSAVSPVASSNVVSPVSYSAVNPVAVHAIGKRDADAEPATVYTTGLPVTTYGAVSHVAGVNSVVAPVSTYSAVSPVVSHAAVKPVATYSAVSPVVSPVTYGAGHVVNSAYAPHSVAATPFGYTHSSNVGICTNHMGVQVPC